MRKPNPEHTEYVNTKGAADFCNLSASFLEKCRHLAPERGPPFVRIGRAIRYPISGLRDFMSARMTGGAK
jgi:hypothetical protein